MQVSLLLPGCSAIPSSVEDVLKSFSNFYLLKNLSVHELLNKDFLESAVYQGNGRRRVAASAPDIQAGYTILCHCVCAGSVYGLSYRTRLDEDNCIALMPNGNNLSVFVC